MVILKNMCCRYNSKNMAVLQFIYVHIQNVRIKLNFLIHQMILLSRIEKRN